MSLNPPGWLCCADVSVKKPGEKKLTRNGKHAEPLPRIAERSSPHHAHTPFPSAQPPPLRSDASTVVVNEGSASDSTKQEECIVNLPTSRRLASSLLFSRPPPTLHTHAPAKQATNVFVPYASTTHGQLLLLPPSFFSGHTVLHRRAETHHQIAH